MSSLIQSQGRNNFSKLRRPLCQFARRTRPSISIRVQILSKLEKPILTKSQGACLAVLRQQKGSKAEIAIIAKLDLLQTATALRALKLFGLAKQDKAMNWRTTSHGRNTLFKTHADQKQRKNNIPGPGAQRLLQILDRPRRAVEIAEKLKVTRQRVHQLVIGLHAQGLVSFGDPENPSWLVMRSDDTTPILSREEERVLSAMPSDYPTTAERIRVVAGMSEKPLRQALHNLMANRFVALSNGIYDAPLFKITAIGLKHPQRDHTVRRANAPHLPVQSNRVRQVLQFIRDSGSARIKDLNEIVGGPHNSINSLVQYLKRKKLVEKTGRDLTAPYSLTDEGRAVLVEMERRLVAQ